MPNLLSFKGWWAVQDLNLRLPPCEGGTLPLSYAPGSCVVQIGDIKFPPDIEADDGPSQAIF